MDLRAAIIAANELVADVQEGIRLLPGAADCDINLDLKELIQQYYLLVMKRTPATRSSPAATSPDNEASPPGAPPPPPCAYNMHSLITSVGMYSHGGAGARNNQLPEEEPGLEELRAAMWQDECVENQQGMGSMQT
jgi:hypothetical protein